MAAGTPGIVALIALFGAIPLTLVLFALLPARCAVVTGAIAAWLFLPCTGVDLPGFPDYTKATAATAGILLGTLVFEPARLAAFRLRWFDLPMLLWSLCPFASSLSNGLGPYDGLSAALGQTIAWFLPYLVGRLYLTDVEGLRELALGMIIGGLCLVPLCLFEFKMSPCVSRMVYGVSQVGGGTVRRLSASAFLQGLTRARAMDARRDSGGLVALADRTAQTAGRTSRWRNCCRAWWSLRLPAKPPLRHC